MSGGGGGGRKKKILPSEDHLDLVPLIDCVFLLLLFFMLCGRLSNDQRTEQITVPPTKTATKLNTEKDWSRVIINVFGNTKTTSGNTPPRNTIRLMAGGWSKEWRSEGVNNFTGYIKLREEMNTVWDKAKKYKDPKSGMDLPQVVCEIRADADTEYRVVQEIQMVLTDSVMVDPAEGLKPRAPTGAPKAFVYIDYTTRAPQGPG